MNYLLDTNILSELVRPAPHAGVERWVRRQSPLALAISVITLGELEKGIAAMPAGRRRTRLAHWAATELPRQFLGRLHPIDDVIAIEWGRLAAAGHAMGRPLPVIDGLLLATARAHALTLVTRDVSDCVGRGIPVFDPWTDTLHG